MPRGGCGCQELAHGGLRMPGARPGGCCKGLMPGARPGGAADARSSPRGGCKGLASSAGAGLPGLAHRRVFPEKPTRVAVSAVEAFAPHVSHWADPTHVYACPGRVYAVPPRTQKASGGVGPCQTPPFRSPTGTHVSPLPWSRGKDTVAVSRQQAPGKATPGERGGIPGEASSARPVTPVPNLRSPCGAGARG